MKEKIKLLVVSDVKFNKDVIQEFENRYELAQVTYFEGRLGGQIYVTKSKVYKLTKYFLLGLRSYMHWRKDRTEYVLFWGQRPAFFFSLLSILDISNLFQNKSGKIIVCEVVNNSKISSKISEFVFNAGVVDKLLFYYKKQYDESNSPKKELFYYWQKSFQETSGLPDNELSSQNYFFSGGATNRDYDQIAKLASQFPTNKFVMACTEKDTSHINFPDNVTLYHDRYGSDFLKLLYNAKIVIVPLKDPCKVSGQVVVLRAVEFGKPVITNLDAKFLQEWMKVDGSEGVLNYKNASQLSVLVKRLTEEPEYFNANVSAVSKMNNDVSYKQWLKDFVDFF